MRDKSKEKILISAIGLFLMFAFMLGTAYAVPHRINYQGFLTDSGGNPVDNNCVEMIFKIFDADENGTELWHDNHNSDGCVQVANGIFNVTLYGLDPSLLNDERWLEVQVFQTNHYETLSPRQNLTSVAYAIKADVAESVAGDAITTTSIVNHTITNDDISTSAAITTLAIDNITAFSTSTFLGDQAGNSSGGAGTNTFIGNSAGKDDTGGSYNTFLGTESGFKNTNGGYNTFLGARAGHENLGGVSNAFIGYEAGYENISGNFNAFLGRDAGHYNDTGAQNTYVGYGAGSGIATGNNGFNNTFIGFYAGYKITEGDHNTFLGKSAGFTNSTGLYNTFIGESAGQLNDTGTNNTFIGAKAGYTNITGSRNVFLGFDAGYNETGSDKLYIANSNTPTPLIYGEFDSKKLQINGELSVTRDGNAAVLSLIDFDGATWNLYSGHGTTGSFSINESGDSNEAKLFIKAGGNVGIGTDSPACKLHVANSTSVWGMLRIENTSAGPNEATIGFDQGVNGNTWIAGVGSWSNEDDFIIGRDGTAGGVGGVQLLIQGSNGNVGIGTTSPAQRLDVAGDIQCVLLHQTSDERLKTNVRQITGALDKIEQIRGVTFEWNEAAESVGATAGKRQIGVIAQEMETVLPELVSTSEDGLKSVSYTNLTAVLIEAVKDQQKIIDDLGAQLDALEENKTAEIESLKNQLSHLRALVEKVMAKQTDSKDNKDLLSMSR